MITIEHDRDHYLVCRVTGTLSKGDYDAALPEMENALNLRQGPLRMMIVLEDFAGWAVDALWEDLKFDIRHRNDFDRIAVVGDSKAEEWGTLISKPFIGAEMRFFPWDRRDDAHAWLSPGQAPGQPTPSPGPDAAA